MARTRIRERQPVKTTHKTRIARAPQQSADPRRPEGSGRVPLLLLLFAALAVKATVLAQLWNHPLLQPHGELDTATYVDLGQRVAAGGPLAIREAFFVSPLYVFFLAAVFKVGGSLLAAKVVQILLGTAAVGLVFATTRWWFGTTSAVIAGVIAITTGLFTFYEVLVLQAALDPFLTACSLYLVTRMSADRGPWTPLAAGVSLGLLVLNRPNALAYAGALAVASIAIGLARRRRNDGAAWWHRGLLLGAGLSVVLAPNAYRNYLVSGDVVLVSSHGGLNFYVGNNASADGKYQRVADITPSIAGQVRDSTRVAEAALGRSLTPSEVSSYFFDRAVTWITAHPRAAATLTARKILLFLNHRSVPLNYSYVYFSRDERTLLMALAVGPWLLVPLGLVGLWLSDARRRVDGYWTWATFVPIYGATVIAFFVSSRYRLPWLVPLCTSAGATIAWGIEHARRADRRWPWGGAAALVVITVVCAWPMGIDDRRSGERARLALWLIEQGRVDEGLARVDDLARDDQQPAWLRFRTGEALASAGRYESAIDQYRRAVALDDSLVDAHLALGQALVVAGRPAEATPHLTHALEAGHQSGVSAVWLVRAWALAGDRARAVEVLTSLPDAVVATSYEVAFDLGSLALQLEAPTDAARGFSAAVAKEPARAEAQEQLGVARLMLESPAEAVAPLETACRLEPSRASAWLNLAVAHAAIGRLDDARREAAESVRLDPKEPRATALLTALGRASR